MKSIFDPQATEELLGRIRALGPDKKALWGRMTVFQMVKHCRMWEQMMVGEKKTRRMLLGRIFGKIALRKMLADDRPMPRNAPTVSGFAVNDAGDVAVEKSLWMGYVQRHQQFSGDFFVHPFFGKLSREQLGQLAYKHSDHHLRQFGV